MNLPTTRFTDVVSIVQWYRAKWCPGCQSTPKPSASGSLCAIFCRFFPPQPKITNMKQTIMQIRDEI